MPAWWTPWSRLSRWGQLKRAFAVALCTFHLVGMVGMGGAARLRARFSKVYRVYGNDLKLTNTWGMFSKRPSSTHVRIEALDRDRRVWSISTSSVDGKGLVDRFRDARLRKIQSKLGTKKDRAMFGAQVLDGWCQYSGMHVPHVQEVRAVETVHELRDDTGRVVREASEDVVMRRTCGPLRAHDLPVRVIDRDGDEEDT